MGVSRLAKVPLAGKDDEKFNVNKLRLFSEATGKRCDGVKRRWLYDGSGVRRGQCGGGRRCDV